MHKKVVIKKSVAAVALTLASSCVVHAQEASANGPVQKVIVTGSNIARIDVETATPVQIMRRDEIVRTGANSVQELLNTLTSSTGSLSDIGGSNSFAGGASSASLRNLGKQSTLILLNSRRVAPYALADYNEVFTNLDSLPLDAIDRIEVLRNGGSAVYGSDAVAGVINIITRSDFKGVQVKASEDQSLLNKQFRSRTASLTGGIGDLAADRYNVLANVELFKRDSVVWRDVIDDINPIYGNKFSTVKDKSGLMFGNRGAPSTFSYPGNLIGVGPVPGCSTVNAAGLCVYDRFQRFEVQPKADRVNVLVSGKFKLGDSMEAFSEILYSRTKTEYLNAFGTYGSTSADATWGDPRNGSARTFTYRYLPATHPLNPTGDEVELRYRFADSGGYRRSDSAQYRVLTGLKGDWAQYQWESAIGVMGSKTTDRSRGAISDSGFKSVVGNYDPAQTDPLFFNRDYKIGQTNSPAVLNTLFPENGYDGKITQYFWDGKVAGDVTTFNGRPVGVAVGADLRHEKYLIMPTANLLAGDIVSNGAATADAQRSTGSMFAEVNLPVTSQLEVQAAGRVDKFPGFNAHVSPKLAMRFEVSKKLMLRGTLESGFRAPNLTESAQSSKFAFDNGITDPKRCSQALALASDLRAQSDALPASDPNKGLLSARADIVEGAECATGVASNVRNNPNLKPETSRSGTIGFVVEPVKGLNLSLDYWNIERRNEIGTRSTDELLAAEDTLAPGTVTRQSLAQDKTFSAAERAKYGVTVGALSGTTGMFENVSKTKTSGFDLGAAARYTTPVGKLDLSSNATYLTELRIFSSTLNGGSYGDNLAGRYDAPKLVANAAATLETGAFSNGLRFTYNSATKLQGDYYDDGYTLDGCASRGWSASECRVDAFARWDYAFSYKGIKNLTLSVFVRNVLDQRPPVDLKAFNRDGGGVIPQSRADVQGRSLRLTAEYKFF